LASIFPQQRIHFEVAFPLMNALGKKATTQTSDGGTLLPA